MLFLLRWRNGLCWRSLAFILFCCTCVRSSSLLLPRSIDQLANEKWGSLDDQISLTNSINSQFCAWKEDGHRSMGYISCEKAVNTKPGCCHQTTFFTPWPSRGPWSRITWSFCYLFIRIKRRRKIIWRLSLGGRKGKMEWRACMNFSQPWQSWEEGVGEDNIKIILASTFSCFFSRWLTLYHHPYLQTLHCRPYCLFFRYSHLIRHSARCAYCGFTSPSFTTSLLATANNRLTVPLSTSAKNTPQHRKTKKDSTQRVAW